ncbi:MAG TPA: response regulator [Oligoflexus sp.]|uniref:response regulator n=1 Tax=Oligoflexus sp. TaxID=1971216 RepID=UPI002D6FD2C9|nr:response regulator [Oligoflexus sp.]HYX33985.1 response regulator [Oligoflexus sp.]
MNQLKALVVDDETDIQRIICDELISQNWEAKGVGDGLLALEQLKNEKYDVIISDISMPKMDGLELLREVRKTDKRVVFVLMSAVVTLPLWEGYALGANAFFGKPFPIHDLTRLLVRMQLPARQRWAGAGKKTDEFKISNHIELDNGEISENFSLGSGGMFVNPGSQNAVKDQILSFRVNMPRFVLEGIGMVMWTRRPGNPNLAPGLGIEFLYLEDSCRELVASLVIRSQVKAFIPAGAIVKKIAGES